GRGPVRPDRGRIVADLERLHFVGARAARMARHALWRSQLPRRHDRDHRGRRRSGRADGILLGQLQRLHFVDSRVAAVTRDLRQVFALAGAFKQGDLAVGGTADDRLRDESRRAILATTVGQIRRTPLVEDGVSDALERTRDRRFDGDLDALTIARVRDTLLGAGLVAWAERHPDALPSEAIAAVAKVMTGAELSSVSRALFNPLGDGEVAIGSPAPFGFRPPPRTSPGDGEA